MTDTLVAGTRLAERYEIEDVIGRGRSPVYRARDTRLGRAVAVKEVGLVAAAADDPASADRSRALREARAAARVHAPGVVQVYDVVEEHTAVWLVMELVRAPSLQRRVAEQGPMDEVTAARLGLGLLDALDAAHAQGVVHRDVRPANVLVADPDDPTVEVPVRLADFGLAALRDDTALAAPGALSGSPAFTAPEQVTGGPSGPATDLWALGAVLYFAVEGTAPFAGDSPAAVSEAVVAGDVRPAERAGRLARIAEMLLATDPARRPGAPRVRAALRAVATGSEPGDDTQEAPAAGAAAPAPAIAAVPTAATAAAATAVPDAVGDRTPPVGSPGAAAPAGAPGALDPTVAAGTEPTLAGRRLAPAAGPRRPRWRRPTPYALAAIVAAVLLLAGLAAVTLGGGDDPDPATPPSTTEVEPKDATPAPERVVPPAGGPPATDPAGSDDPPAGGEEEGPADTGPETTTTTAEPTTTAPPTTAPTTTPPTTAPPTTGAEPPPTTVPGEGGETSTLSDASATASAGGGTDTTAPAGD